MKSYDIAEKFGNSKEVIGGQCLKERARTPASSQMA